MRRSARRAWPLALIGVLATAGVVAGQEVESLAAGCIGSAIVSARRCTEVAVAARAVQGHVGLLAGLGSEVAGSASTLGRRLPGTPRVAASTRFSLLGAALPSLVDRVNEPYPRSSFLIPSIEGAVAVGLFDGVRVMPTVGGLLSLDVFGRASFMFPPRGEGFEKGVRALTLGARVGVIRESFTLPGVSVSVSRRRIGTVRVASVELGDPGAVVLDPRVTALRLTVGKDLLAAGFIAGAGWERYSGSATMLVSDGTQQFTFVTDEYVSERLLYFGSASLSFLILQLSAELGWAEGFGAVPLYSTAPFDPTAGTLFGGVSVRLTI